MALLLPRKLGRRFIATALLFIVCLFLIVVFRKSFTDTLLFRSKDRPNADSTQVKKKDYQHIESVSRNPFSKDNARRIQQPPDSVVPKQYYDTEANSNPHNHAYIINHPNLCLHHSQILLLVIVQTQLSNFERRMTIRDSFSVQKQVSDIVPVIFIMGSFHKRFQGSIFQENSRYDDIVQEDFIDSFSNTSLKTVMAFKWASTYCSQAKFIMIMNDDVVVDLFKLISYLQLKPKNAILEDSFTVCYMFPCCTPVIGFIKKSYEEERYRNCTYSGRYYPAFCSRSAYILPFGALHKLYHMSLHTPSFIPVEVWVGVLTEKSGVHFSDTYSLFGGIGSPPSLLKEFLSLDYLNSPAMIGVVGYDFPGQEVTVMKYVLRIIKDQHRHKRTRRNPSADTHVVEKVESGGVFYLAMSMMFVDLLVMVLIFIVIFFRKHKK